MKNKIITYLSFAKKSGSLEVGLDAVKTSILKNKSVLIIMCCDISENSKRKIITICEKNSVKYIIVPLKSLEMINIFYKKIVVISLNNFNLANAILNTIDFK